MIFDIWINENQDTLRKPRAPSVYIYIYLDFTDLADIISYADDIYIYIYIYIYICIPTGPLNNLTQSYFLRYGWIHRHDFYQLYQPIK